MEIENLFTTSFCYLDMCLWFLGPEDVGLWSCVGADHGHYELKKDMAEHCYDYIYFDEDRTLLDTTAFCVTDLPVCVYSYKRAGYDQIKFFNMTTLGVGGHSTTPEMPEGNLMGFIVELYWAHIQTQK